MAQKIWFWILAVLAVCVLSACGGDSGSSAEEISSSSGLTEEKFNARCYERFDIADSDPWSTTLAGNEFVANHICDELSYYMMDMLAFYARCTDATYNESKNRYEIEVITEQKYMHIWVEISGCKYKLGTDGDMKPMVENYNERSFDDCFCKVEDGETYYRNVLPKEQENESSSSENEPSYDESSSSNSVEESSSSSSELADEKKCDDLNAFVDERDGNVYRVTQIGNQIWMAENLRYAKTTGVCIDENDDCSVRGLLYTFLAATGNSPLVYPLQGICPDGFHLPQNSEWRELRDYVVERGGSSAQGTFDLMSVDGWDGYNHGTDKYGFTAVPTGEMNSDFEGKNDECARFWTSTEEGSNSAYEWYLGNCAYLTNQTYKKTYGYAVRCVADGSVKLTKNKSCHVGENSSSSVSSSSNLSSSSISSSSQEQPDVTEPLHTITKAGGCENCNSFTDSRDGSAYKVAEIAGLIWMAEDLRFAGTEEYPLATAGWGKCPTEDCSSRGLLYNFDGANSACPEGWRMPTFDEMKNMFVKAMGSLGSSSNVCDMMVDEHAWAKTCSTYNLSGFAAVPTGEWGSSGYKSDSYARYWTSTTSELRDSDGYMLYIGLSNASSQPYSKEYGYAARCVASADVVLDAVK